MLDLDAYLARIGLSGRPGIVELQRAHVTSIPFENLDPHRGVPVSLAPEDLERKLVSERRGGYCFEQNLLLKAALEELGAEVELILARVRFGAPPGAVRPRSHLCLRVRADGATWHADVGFGERNPLEPLPWGPSGEHERAGWRYRIVEDGSELVIQTFEERQWVDMYGFVPEPAPAVDLEVSNWFTSTHPGSPFVTGLVVAVQSEGGTRARLSNRDGLSMTEQTPERATITSVAEEEIPALLATRFGLPGFALAPQDGSTNSGGCLVIPATTAAS
jgi:N-hydroxyarylamine O-acetyltransferase